MWSSNSGEEGYLRSRRVRTPDVADRGEQAASLAPGLIDGTIPAMKPREFVQVDPATLHLPGSRRDGADPRKLQRQLARHGLSIDGIPPPEVNRGSDRELVIFDGVTRATRVAKYLPGTPITV